MTARPTLVVLAAGMARRYGGCKPLAPVGPMGQAVIDLTAGDALGNGFGDVVLVVGPSTGPAIEYHVRRCWPDQVQVSFAQQTVPLGTAHAVLCARSHVPDDHSFAVVNADDLYGPRSFETLAAHLSTNTDHALVAFHLEDTIATGGAVTRGTVEVGPDGHHLSGIAERRFVSRHVDGSFASEDGIEPRNLDPATPVSVNLWGFHPSMWQALEHAVCSVHPHIGSDGTVKISDDTDIAHEEVLLPEVVAAMVAPGATGSGDSTKVAVLQGSGRCLGVTHAEDLPIVRAQVEALVGRGERPESPWAFLR